jgi:hypothetical protein
MKRGQSFRAPKSAVRFQAVVSSRAGAQHFILSILRPFYTAQPFQSLTNNKMANKGWFNLEAAGGAIPETQFFEGDSAFKFLGLSRTQRLYGFIGW